MTSTGGPPAPEGATSRSSGLEGFIDELNRCWELTTRSSRRILEGRYTFTDAAADLNDWLSSSTSYAVRVADDLWGEAPPFALHSDTWTGTMTVLRRPDDRPLTLQTTGLRAIGKQIEIPPSAITFDPPVLQLRDNTFTVHVSMVAVPTRETLIFEGIINALESPGPVSDPVRANNRDGGPVR